VVNVGNDSDVTNVFDGHGKNAFWGGKGERKVTKR
jgi:hypothetical protein